MEKFSPTTIAAIRILVISVACFGGYLFSQSVIFGKKLESSTLITGIVCSFLVGVAFHFMQRRKEKKENKS